MRNAPVSNRQPPKHSHREPVKYLDALSPVETAVSVSPEAPPADADSSLWVAVGGGWYRNLETGEKRHGRPKG